MSKFLSISAAFFIGTIVGAAGISLGHSDKAAALQGTAQIAAALNTKVGVHATAILPTKVPGLFEVDVGDDVVYADATGKYLFDGHLVDMDTKSSLTAQRKLELAKARGGMQKVVGADAVVEELPRMDWHKLNLANAIKTVYGKPTPGRVLVTFEDPLCPICRDLHAEVAKLHDITVYTFPVSIKGPHAREVNEAIWCSKDRSTTWNDVLATGKAALGRPDCDLRGLDANMDFMHEMKVGGTPMIFTADGTRIPQGFADAATIERKLASLKG